MQTSEMILVTELATKAAELSLAARLDLARRILESTKAPTHLPPALDNCPSAAEIRAKYRTDKPAPDNVTVRQWIDEHRMEKFHA